MSPRSPSVLVFGGTGMLGRLLWVRLGSVPGWRVRRTQRRNVSAPAHFDALDSDSALERVIAEGGGSDYLINAIGVTQSEIRSGAVSAEVTEEINARFPHRLATAAARSGSRVIHISTDGVFSGNSGPYSEACSPDPDDLYGRTKLAGEPVAPHVLTLRCSIIGPDPDKGRGLFEWFRRLRPGERARGYVDQRWNGVTTEQLAQLCRLVVEQDLLERITARAPVRHFCPNRPVSKFQLLCLFREALGSGAIIEPVESGVPLNRILTSQWEDLCLLAGGPLDMADAIRAMVAQPPLPPKTEGIDDHR